MLSPDGKTYRDEKAKPLWEYGESVYWRVCKGNIYKAEMAAWCVWCRIYDKEKQSWQGIWGSS